MTPQPNETNASETRRRERPTAPLRRVDAHFGERAGRAATPARSSARLSFPQLLRAGALVLFGSLCVALVQSGSARAGEVAPASVSTLRDARAAF